LITSQEQAHHVIDPPIWGDLILVQRRGKHRAQSITHVAEVVRSNEQFAPGLRAHIGSNGRIGHSNEPLAANEPVVPIGLPVEVATQGVLGATRLPDRVDSSRPPLAFRQPLTFRKRNSPALHLDGCDPRIREQDQKINLDVAMARIGEPHAIENYLTGMQLGSQGLPHP
jgi:hypothetical protein